MYTLTKPPAPYKFVPNAIIWAAVCHNNLDEACIVIQDHIGQTDGGVASLAFSGQTPMEDGNHKEWLEASHWQRETMIRKYLNSELAYEEVEPFKVDEREIPQKWFFQKDLTGRGYHVEGVTAEQILDSNMESEDVSELDDFIYRCEVGDKWENGQTEFTRIA
jgi:hypothetical protein